jgi:hypothetical protein
MVHLSVALFFAGLAIFVFVANQTVSYHLMCALALGTFTYLFFTLSSFPSHNSPYQTPYTLPLWMILQIMLLFLSLFPGRWRGNRDKYKDNLVQGMQVALEKSAEVNSKEYEQEALKETLTSLRQDHQFEEFVDAAPSVLRVDKVIDSDMTSALGSLLKQAVGHLVGTCRADIMANGVRKRRLVACYKTIWCLEDLSQDHAEELWTKWMSPRRYPVKDERETLCVEAWKAAQETATNYDGRLALLAEYSQALLAMMWATGRYSTTQDELDEVKDILQYQLDYPSAVPINTPLDPPSNNLMVAITTRFFKAAFRVMEDPLAADGNLHLMFTDAAKSFFEKSLAVSRQDFAQLDFGDWDAGFFSLISLFEDARRPRDQTLLFPNATFRDIRSLYDYVNRLDVSNANRVGVFEPYLRAASVCCFVTLVHTFLDDLWASDREGDQAMSSRMLRACWNLTDILHRVQDAKVLIRCHCARAMLKVGWWKAVHNSLNQPEAMGTGPPLAYRCHSEVSVPYVASAGVQNQDNPDFFLVVADELLSNLVNDQCIYDFKGDSTVADDFEMALRHVLASGSTSTRPSSVLSGSLQQVLRLAQRDGLVRIKSFIDDLDSLDGDGQRWI